MSRRGKTPNVPSDRPAKARYKGAPPFSDSARDQLLFRGRDDEIDQLFHRVLGSPLILLFGTSGLGKTSLLQAGLFPRLRAKTFLPIPIRLNQKVSPVQAIVASAREACAKEGASLTEGDPGGVWEFFQTSLIWKDGLLHTPVLVFDQFEEVFTRQDQRFRTDLALELGALASGVAPERLGVEAVRSARSRERSPTVKLLISLREDYLGALQELSASIPGLFRERVRLLPLSEVQATKAICEPAALDAGDAALEFFALPFDYEPDALKAMLDFLEGKSQIIEPFQLQLLCSHLEEIVAERQTADARRGRVTVSDLGGVEGMERVQEEFYDRTIGALPGRVERQRARRLCEEGLLDTGGHRALVEENQILTEYHLSADTLGAMVDRRLLQREQRLESTFYEISHDRLAETIFHSRPWFRAIPKRVRQTAIGALAVALFAVGGLLLLNRKIEAARAEAVSQQHKAEAATADAEGLVAYLIGPLLDQVRPAGRNSVLNDVQTHVDSYLNKTDRNQRAETTKNDGLAHRNKGDLLLAQGHVKEAVDHYNLSRLIFERLLAGQPSQGDWAAELARTLEKLSGALEDQGHFADALAAQEKALALRKKLCSSPGSPCETIDLVDSENGVASALTHVGRPVAALAHFDKAISLLEPLQRKAGDDRRVLKARWEAADGRAGALDYAGRPGVREGYLRGDDYARAFRGGQPLSADAWQSWATAVSRLPGQSDSPAAAIRDYERVRHTFIDLVHWDESNAAWKRELAATRLLQCEEFTAMDRFREAKTCFAGVRNTFEDLARMDATDVSRKNDLAWLHGSTGKLLVSAGDLRGARGEFELAERLSNESAGSEVSVARLRVFGALEDLGDLLVRQKDYPGAIEVYRRGRRLAAELHARMPETASTIYYQLWFYDGEIQALKAKASSSALAALRDEKVRFLAAAIAGRPADANLYNWRWVQQAGMGDEAKSRKDVLAALAAYRDGLKDIARAATLDPGNPAHWVEMRNAHKRIADLLRDSGDSRGAEAEYRKAAESGTKAAALAPETAKHRYWLYDIYYSVGLMLRDKGDRDGALREYRKAAEAAGRASELSPQNADYANRRFLALYEMGRILQDQMKNAAAVSGHDGIDEFRGAEPAILRAISLEKQNATFVENRSQLYQRMAEALARRKDWPAAGEAYREAISATETAAKLEPGSAKRYTDLYSVLTAYAGFLKQRGDSESALSEYRKAAEAAARAFELEPRQGAYANQHFLGLYNAGLVLEDQEKSPPKLVLEQFRLAEKPVETAMELELGNATFAANRSVLERHIGRVLVSLKDWRGAEYAYREAVSSAQKVVAADPKHAARYYQLYESHLAFGDLCRDRDDKDLSAAIEHYNQAVSAVESAMRLDSKDPELPSDAYVAHYRIAALRAQMENSAEAETEYRRAAAAADTALRLEADAVYANQEALALDRLGTTLVARGDDSRAAAAYADSIKAVTRAIQLDSTNVTYRMNLGLIQSRLGKLKRKARDYTAAKAVLLDALQSAVWASDREPDNAYYRRQVYFIQWSLGQVCEDGGEMQPAREYGYQALANARKAADRDTGDPAAQDDVHNDIKELEVWTRKMMDK